MVELATLQAVSYIMGFLGVFVAAVYYVLNIQNNKRNQELSIKAQQQTLETRQTQLFMQLFDRWGDPSFAKMYGEYRYETCAKANNDPKEICKIAVQALFESYDPDVIIPIHTLAQYFEGISILVQKKLIDVDTVERLLSGRIIWYWDSTEPFIKYVRERVGDPKMYRELEILANEMKNRKGINKTGING